MIYSRTAAWMMSLLTFSLLYCIKQMDSMLLRVCSVIHDRRRQSVVRTFQWHTRLTARVRFFRCYHILMSSVIYYWANARQHGIFLVIRWKRNQQYHLVSKESVQVPPALGLRQSDRIRANAWKVSFPICDHNLTLIISFDTKFSWLGSLIKIYARQ